MTSINHPILFQAIDSQHPEGPSLRIAPASLFGLVSKHIYSPKQFVGLPSSEQLHLTFGFAKMAIVYVGCTTPVKPGKYNLP